MHDPLDDFDWKSLYQRYDGKCKRTNRFDRNKPALDCFGDERPQTDRDLYYAVLDRVRIEQDSSTLMALSTYEAALYWKMYSTSPRSNNEIQRSSDVQRKLTGNLSKLNGFPRRLEMNADAIGELVGQVLSLQLYGMKLPVCTTILHFMYPHTLTIFDQMILRAVGYEKDEIKAKQLTQSVDLYKKYLLHHWSLVRKYSSFCSGFKESPERVIEMALWVSRGE